MRDVQKILIGENSPLLEALEVINNDVLQIALVVDEAGHLLGTLTDGDIRRAILKNHSLDSKVINAMNAHPITVVEGVKIKEALFLMRAKGIRQIPVVNKEDKVIGIYVLDDLIAGNPKSNYVVIMAGGLGTRLRPLTEEIPKPMLRVGDKPILQTIIEQLRDNGLTNIMLAVNYLAHQIEEYFHDGSDLGVNITYLKEKFRMGTAGALTLINNIPSEPLLVMNGDILTNVDYSELIRFHEGEKNEVTMCVRNFDYRVPYGVLGLNDDLKVSFITEKPLYSFLVSAGIYVLNPRILSLVPQDSYVDMPSLLQKVIELHNGVGCFPIRDYWIDIGENGEYQKANADYGRVFNGDSQNIRNYSG